MKITRPSLIAAALFTCIILLCLLAGPLRSIARDDVATLDVRMKNVLNTTGLPPEDIAKFNQILGGLTAEERGETESELVDERDTALRLRIMQRLIAMPLADAVERCKKQHKAIRTLEELRLIDSATDQYAIETNKTQRNGVPGMHPTWADLENYLRSGTPLYNTGADVFGRAYGPFTVDSIPLVSPETFNALSDVADPIFWSPYK